MTWQFQHHPNAKATFDSRRLCQKGCRVYAGRMLKGSKRSDLPVVSSLNRPGGNLTGVYFLNGAIESKGLGLVRQLVPNPAITGVLLNPNSPPQRFNCEICQTRRA